MTWLESIVLDLESFSLVFIIILRIMLHGCVGRFFFPSKLLSLCLEMAKRKRADLGSSYKQFGKEEKEHNSEFCIF